MTNLQSCQKAYGMVDCNKCEFFYKNFKNRIKGTGCNPNDVFNDEQISDTEYYLDAIKEDYFHILLLNNILNRIKQDKNYQSKPAFIKIKKSIHINYRDIRYLYNAIIKENHFDEMLKIIDNDLHDKLKFDLFNNFGLENRLVEVK